MSNVEEISIKSNPHQSQSQSNESQRSVCSCDCDQTCPPPTGVQLSSKCIGYVADSREVLQPVYQFTWTNGNLMSASVMTYGATVMSIKVPNRLGVLDDVILGFETLADYIENTDYEFGATLGRSANVIADAEYCLRKCEYVALTPNLNNRHHINGGSRSLSRVNWTSSVIGSQVIMSYLSEDGEEGYPGALMVQLMFVVTENNSFVISYMAQCDKCTPVNISTRLYLNLGGHSAGKSALIDHIMFLNAKQKIEYHKGDFIPTGTTIKIGNCDSDCRLPSPLRTLLRRSPEGCLHESFLIHQSKSKNVDKNFVGRIIHTESGRVLEVYSTQRCAEFSTCHNFPQIDSNSILELDGDTISIEDDCADLCQRIVKEIVAESLDNTKMMNDILCELCDQVIRAKMEFDGTIPKDVAFTLLQNICDELRRLRADETEEENEDKHVEEDNISVTLPINGKSGAKYGRNDGFYLQMQNFPDAVHHLGRFGDILLQPGQIYSNNLTYKFGLHMSDIVPDIDRDLSISLSEH